MAKNPNYVPELTRGERNDLENIRTTLARASFALDRTRQLYALMEAHERLTKLVSWFVLRDVEIE